MVLEFGIIKPQLLILLIYPFGILGSRLIVIYFEKTPFFYLFLFFISHFFALIPLMIINKKNKPSHKEKKEVQNQSLNNSSDNEKSGNIFLEIKEKEKEKQIHEIKAFHRFSIIRKCSFIGILYFYSYFFFYYSYLIMNTSFYGNISIATEIIYFSIINRIILGKKIYSHHLFSMILITICIFGLYILLMIEFIQNNSKWNAWSDFVFPTILNCLVYFPFCYFLIQAKLYMEKYFISAYELIVFLGIFCTLLLLILEPITFFIPCKKKVMCYQGHFAGIISGFKQCSDKIDILYSFLMAIGLFMTALGLWLTVENLSPCHFLTSDSIITFSLNILSDCYKDFFLMVNPLFYILSLITIFACLVYNEIIIINICKLSYYTSKYITNRQSLEYIENRLIIPETLEDNFSLDSNQRSNFKKA